MFHDGHAMVKVNGKFGIVGYIDHSGNRVIPEQYGEGTSFHEGVAAVRQKDKFKWLLIDTKGTPIMDREFDSPTVFSEGLAPVMVNKKVGYMDKQGKMVIKPKFQSGSIFVNGIAPVQVGDKCGYIDKTGKMVIQPRFDWDQYAIDQFTHYYTTFKHK
jgi:hypothetical protein